jgi:hypothetical protein
MGLTILPSAIPKRYQILFKGANSRGQKTEINKNIAANIPRRIAQPIEPKYQ